MKYRVITGAIEPRELEPPSSYSWRVQGVLASFMLDLLNRGLDPPISWCFL
jgi:hypothetical protein